jgi:hypothetical protein
MKWWDREEPVRNYQCRNRDIGFVKQRLGVFGEGAGEGIFSKTPSPENSSYALYAASSTSFLARRVRMAAVVFTIGTTF